MERQKDILAADIGGTSSRFARFALGGGDELLLEESASLRTSDAGSFPELFEMLARSGFGLSPSEADASCFAVAGPVRGMVSTPPNIPWDVDLSGYEGNAVLINDFVAQAYACISRVGQEAALVLGGEPDPQGTISVLGPGTGLGKAALVPDGAGGRAPMPSEGGHAAFPFMKGREQEYQAFLIEREGGDYITLDSVVTGRGIAMLHEFLSGKALSPEETTQRLVPGTETLEWGARLLGRAARDFALETLATGGLFVSGGVAARSPALVEHEAFEAEFRSSRKHSALLARIPVRLISDEQAGLWGAAERARLELEHDA
jgi:glucokinase